MTSKIKRIYRAGLRNEEFLADIKEADGDERPDEFSGNVVKTIFSTIYYGWLVGKYGASWEKNM